ncbi:MAG: protein kinase, partial [candidate division NC10 bacterium]
MIGTTLSHYKVLEKIGQGGMGEVYRAEDTNLDREVAIKVLPEQFTQDPQRLARFEREAKLLASLNHPNIAAIYGFEKAEGVHFLALELVPGETLAERVAKGPLPVEEALEVCRQIAEGVEAAHEKGVIHRDLKPANVKVTPEGKVKILDFGLAKAFEEEIQVEDISQSPTLTEEMTRAGVILGTAAYMSPEQAKGKPVDKRADIFAFGAVLYELLTGKRVFQGETITETLGAIIHKEPEWDLLPTAVPRALARLLHRCLAKDPQQRLRDIGDAKLDLEEIEAGSVVDTHSTPIVSDRRHSLGWLSASALVGALAVLGLMYAINSDLTPAAQTVRSVIPLSDPIELESWRPALTISSDGSRLFYVGNRDGRRQLFEKRMDQFEATPIPGTEGAYSPVLSPSEDWLGFIDEWEVKKISLDGGTPVHILGVPPVTRGVTWILEDDTFVYTSSVNGPLVHWSPEVGVANQSGDSNRRQNLGLDLTVIAPERADYSHRWPVLLPGGNAVLFTVGTGDDFSRARIEVLLLNTNERKVIQESGTSARYVASGHLVFARDGTLMAAPFDLDTLEVTGQPQTVVENIMMDTGGAAHYTVSENGTLVYVPGSVWTPNRSLVWVDRGGDSEPIGAPGRAYMEPRLSPDGRFVAVTIPEGSNYDIWRYDLQRGNLDRMTTDPGEDFSPVWDPSGLVLFFSSELSDQGPTIFAMSPDSSNDPAQFVPKTGQHANFPSSLAPDGSSLA